MADHVPRDLRLAIVRTPLPLPPKSGIALTCRTKEQSRRLDDARSEELKSFPSPSRTFIERRFGKVAPDVAPWPRSSTDVPSIKAVRSTALRLSDGHGRLGATLRGYTRDPLRAVRPYFTGLSRSCFIMAVREGFPLRLQYSHLKSKSWKGSPLTPQVSWW